MGCRPEEAKKTIRRKEGAPRVASLIASSFFIFSIEKGRLSLLHPLYPLFTFHPICPALSVSLCPVLPLDFALGPHFVLFRPSTFFSAPSDSPSIPLRLLSSTRLHPPIQSRVFHLLLRLHWPCLPHCPGLTGSSYSRALLNVPQWQPLSAKHHLPHRQFDYPHNPRVSIPNVQLLQSSSKDQ